MSTTDKTRLNDYYTRYNSCYHIGNFSTWAEIETGVYNYLNALTTYYAPQMFKFGCNLTDMTLQNGTQYCGYGYKMADGIVSATFTNQVGNVLTLATYDKGSTWHIWGSKSLQATNSSTITFGDKNLVMYRSGKTRMFCNVANWFNVPANSYVDIGTLPQEDWPASFCTFITSTGYGGGRILNEASINKSGVVTLTNNTSSQIQVQYWTFTYLTA